MTRAPTFFRWLTWAALTDWLIGRTISRTAIFMPKSPLVIAAYQAVTFVGQVAGTLTALLAVAALGWIAWREWRERRATALPLVFTGLISLNLLSLFVLPSGRLAAAYPLLVMIGVGLIGWRVWSEGERIETRIAWLLPAAAILSGGMYQLSQLLRWPPSVALAFFNAGELFVAASPFGFWWSVRRRGRDGLRPYVWGAIPALTVAMLYLVNPAMTGIIAIWSVGLTLYLPWPLYVLGLWLAGATAIIAVRRSDAIGWALLLLAAGGYVPQLSAHIMLGLVALHLASLGADALHDPVYRFRLREDTSSTQFSPERLIKLDDRDAFPIAARLGQPFP